MSISNSTSPSSFVKIKDKYQVYLWDHPDRKKGMIVSSDTGQVEAISTGLARILRLMTGGRTLMEIETRVANDYNIPISLGKEIVGNVVEQFEAEGKIEINSKNDKAKSFLKTIELPYHLSFLQIQITNRCNLRCMHCYADSKDDEVELSSNAVFDIINEFVDLGGVKIFITGGEPLIHRHFETIIAYARRKRLFVYVSTNGYALNDEWADKFAELGVGAVNISVDGNNAETHDFLRKKKGSFDRALRAVDLLLEREIACATQTTVFTGNLGQSTDIINYFRPRGVAECYFVRMIPDGRGKDHKFLIPSDIQYKELKEKIYRCRAIDYGDNIYPKELTKRKWRCSGGVSQLYIQSDGRCYPCPSLTNKQFLFGKYPQSSLKEIWMSKSPGPSELRAFNINEIERCKNCMHRNYCRCGCYGNALINTGDWRNPDPFHCITMHMIKGIKEHMMGYSLEKWGQVYF